MDLMFLRRRILMANTEVPPSGTFDFYLLNRNIGTNKRQTLNINPLAEDASFTILIDWQKTGGISQDTNNFNLDVFSCNETNGNFNNAIRIGQYAQYLMNRVKTTGQDCNLNTYPQYKDKRYRWVIRYDSTAESNNLYSRMSFWESDGEQRITTNNVTLKTITLPIGTKNANIGGENGRTLTSDRTGIIYGLYLYNRALTEAQMEDYLNSGIIA